MGLIPEEIINNDKNVHIEHKVSCFEYNRLPDVSM